MCFLIIGALIMLVPFAWMILTAFKTKSRSDTDESVYNLSITVENRSIF